MSGEVQCIHNHSAHSLIIAGAGGAAHFAVRVNKKEYNLWVSFGWSGRVSTRKTLEKNMVKREKLEQQGWESNLN
ncbi:unnamed protein product [Eruca vesicaria subsp. sativa]|uniref:Uncharacterized protein n=1 Tax=Eruca vesicaria subsp. sativa TaxID=29727 RepID=A0ABC8IU58_ERUVS|nr:unnamed protein product [Eruca vesicaria subsp. sativa]